MVLDVAGLQQLHESIRAGVIAKTKSPKPTTGMNSADATLGLLAIMANYTRGKDPSTPPWISRAVDRFGSRSREKEGMGLADIGAWHESVKTVRNPIRRELALFMLLTGLRETDAMTATRDHLDETNRTLFLPEPKGHKENRDRSFTLPLTDAAMGCIFRARALQRTPSAILFPNLRGKRFSGTDLERRDKKFASGHRLRHSFASIAEDIGIDEPTRARLLNHSAETETAKYSNPRKISTKLRDAMEKISDAIVKEIKL